MLYKSCRKYICSLLFTRVRFWGIPWTAACQASMSFTICLSLLRLMLVESVMPFNHLILHCPLLYLQSFPASCFFPVSLPYASDGQSIRASASASVLPKNIQSWFSLRLTDMISLLYKGLSRVFSSTTILKASVFFNFQPCLWSNSHICPWLLEKP